MGLLKTGDILVGVHRGTEHQAIVLEDGRIKLASGEPFTSPSSAAASLLRQRAAELADSTSPDAWVGEQILSGLVGRQS